MTGGFAELLTGRTEAIAEGGGAVRGHVQFEMPEVRKVADSGAWRPGQKLELEHLVRAVSRSTGSQAPSSTTTKVRGGEVPGRPRHTREAQWDRRAPREGPGS